jgi:hypothetical protein
MNNIGITEASRRLSWMASYRQYLVEKGYENLYNTFEAEDAYETGRTPREAGDAVIEKNNDNYALDVDNELNKSEDGPEAL